MSSNPDKVHLFVLNCAVIASELRNIHEQYGTPEIILDSPAGDDRLMAFIRQIELDVRVNAASMANHYQIFYILENSIRKLIIETLEAAHGPEWWERRVPQEVRSEAKKNIERESQQGVSTRSEEEIDYITFGQLGDIIRHNWSDFAGMLSNPGAVSRVLAQLNMLRGPIAHCGKLAEDEVDRLKLSIKDWFRVLAGPASK